MPARSLFGCASQFQKSLGFSQAAGDLTAKERLVGGLPYDIGALETRERTPVCRSLLGRSMAKQERCNLPRSDHDAADRRRNQRATRKVV